MPTKRTFENSNNENDEEMDRSTVRRQILSHGSGIEEESIEDIGMMKGGGNEVIDHVQADHTKLSKLEAAHTAKLSTVKKSSEETTNPPSILPGGGEFDNANNHSQDDIEIPSTRSGDQSNSGLDVESMMENSNTKPINETTECNDTPPSPVPQEHHSLHRDEVTTMQTTSDRSRPGAYSIPGVVEPSNSSSISQLDINNALEDNPQNESFYRVPLTEARLVEDEEEQPQPELVFAEPIRSSSKWAVDTRDRRVQTGMVIIFILLTVMASIFVRAKNPIPTLQNQTDLPTATPSDSPTNSPTPTPTLFSWVRLGSDILAPRGSVLFGWSVSLSADGNRVAIGAPQSFCVAPENCTDDDAEKIGNVQVYEYEEDQRRWTRLGTDILHGDNSLDEAGSSVALSADGTHLAVGFKGADVSSAAAVVGSNHGKVRVYRYQSGFWMEKGRDIFGERSGDEAGSESSSVSISADGNRIAIGVGKNDGENDITDSNVGHVRIFEYDGSDWSQLGSDLDGETFGEASGFTVELSSDGNCIVVGSPMIHSTGLARVYRYESESWTRMGQQLEGDADLDKFGYDVSLSSNCTHVAVSANGHDNNRGHVRVYEYIAETDLWEQLGEDIDGEKEGDKFGHSISLSSNGSRLVVGAPQHDDITPRNSGHAQAFDFDGSTWRKVGNDLSDERNEDFSGWSLSISANGQRVAVGSPEHSSIDSFTQSSGNVRIYELT